MMYGVKAIEHAENVLHLMDTTCYRNPTRFQLCSTHYLLINPRIMIYYIDVMLYSIQLVKQLLDSATLMSH